MSLRRLPVATLLSLVLAGWPAAGRAVAERVVFARHLALSPDGRTLAFSWAGDVWTVPVAGGAARRLTANPADDGHPVWSRDGRLIAFSSARYGAANLFLMNSDGSQVRRLTFSERDELPSDFALDGRYVYFHSRAEGRPFWEPKVYRVPVGGGQPWAAMDCYAAGARLSPDGRYIAFTRGGSKWWRRGYRGSANHDIWLRELESGRFFQLTDFDGTDRLPCWDGAGGGLYFVSDRGGTLNVWYQPIDGRAARQLTRLEGDGVRDLSVALDGKTLAFTCWDKLYVMSLPDGQPRQIAVTAAGDLPRQGLELRRYTRDADESEPAPDGKEIALVVHGEIYVIKTDSEKPARRVTRSPFRDQQVTWSPDGRALFFVSDRAGQEDIYRATSAEEPPRALSDSLRFSIERVTDDAAPERFPLVAPDGSRLAFIRSRGDLHVRDLKTGRQRLLVESWNPPNYRWSPDGKWIAYQVEDAEYNSDIWVVAADGGAAPVNISQHPDDDINPQWSSDGQLLAFASRRAGFEYDLYLVFLSRALDEKSPADLAEYFKRRSELVGKRKPPKETPASGPIALGSVRPTTRGAAPPAPAPPPALRERIRRWLKTFLEAPARAEKKRPGRQEEYEYELETAYRRIRRVTALPGDQSRFRLSPDGSVLAFTSRQGGQAALYRVKWDGKDLKRILSGRVRALRWGLDGKRLYYLRGGVPGSCRSGGSDAKLYPFTARLAVVRAQEARQKFFDAARMLGLRFYHPTLKGLDWPGLTKKYAALALRTHTVGEFNEVFNLLQGQLNASHLGIRGPGSRPSQRIGVLGCDFDPGYGGPGLRVAGVIARSPADRAESRLVPGDILLKVNQQPVGPGQALGRALLDSVGEPVVVEYLPAGRRVPATARAPAGPASRPRGGPPQAQTLPAEAAELVIRPVSYARLADLRYRAWVDRNARYVEEHSGGRVGYIHIRAMGASAFNVFERDLYAVAHDKQGLIIDVRNNGGGWTADWVLAVLTVRRHAYTVSRGGAPGYPQGRLVFYAWTKPATMMCNQYSYSNAEIVAHAFQNLARGPLVGVPTFGAVISTGSYRLIDGASLRMPTRGWYTLPDGVDMENHGAVPDVLVPVTPADEVAGRRPQLDAAIEATLKQIAAARPGP